MAGWREVALEGPTVSEWCEAAEEGKFTGVVECDQPGEEQAAEQLAEDAHRQEEPRSRGDPAFSIECDAAARHDHVHAGMVGECRSRREELRETLGAALGAMHRAASASFLKGDPLAEQMQTLAASIGALGEIYDASADTQLEIADQLRTQADTVADGAIDKVHASGVAIIDQLAPRLAARSKRQAGSVSRRCARTILGGAAGLGAALALVAGVSYAAGFTTGRTQGEVSAHTIAAAMVAGPAAASDWASLMADNDPAPALAACRKSVSTDPHGRRYCAMPVWLDPPTAPWRLVAKIKRMVPRSVRLGWIVLKKSRVGACELIQIGLAT